MSQSTGAAPPASGLLIQVLPPRRGTLAIRRFTLGSATDRKIVVVDVKGTNLTVLRVKPDGTTRRQSQELPTAAAARTASEQLAGELIARGYSEQAASGTTAAAAKLRTKVAKVAAPADYDQIDNGLPYGLIEEVA